MATGQPLGGGAVTGVLLDIDGVLTVSWEPLPGDLPARRLTSPTGDPCPCQDAPVVGGGRRTAAGVGATIGERAPSVGDGRRATAVALTITERASRTADPVAHLGPSPVEGC